MHNRHDIQLFRFAHKRNAVKAVMSFFFFSFFLQNTAEKTLVKRKKKRNKRMLRVHFSCAFVE